MKNTTTETIQIVVNGQVRAVPANRSLDEILAFLEIDATRVAVELDRDIVRRSLWKQVTIAPNAQLEIVQFVGGG